MVVIERIAELLPEDGVAVDVGASLDGDDWTGPMLARAGRVFAFEPEPVAFANLQDHYGNRRNLVLEQKACVEVDGLVCLGRYGSHLTTLFDGRAELLVLGVSLDSYFAGGPAVDLLKIDVDGGECLVLRGARKVIGLNKGIKLVLEIHAVWLEKHGVPAGELEALLADLDLVLLDDGRPLAAAAIAGFGDRGYNVLLKRGIHAFAS